MPSDNIRISQALLELVSEATGAIGTPAGVREVLTQLDAAGWHVITKQELRGGILRLYLPENVEAETEVSVGGFPHLRLRVRLQKDGARPFIEVLKRTTEGYVEIQNLTLSLGFDAALLRPEGASAARAEASYQGGLRVEQVDGEWEVSLGRDTSASLQASALAGADISVSLSDFSFVLSSRQFPAELSELGYGSDFRGLIAARGEITLLSQAVFGGSRGITLPLKNVAISKDGINCLVEKQWAVVLADTGIDATNSEMAGHLFDANWQLALSSVAGRIRDNSPESLRISGAVNVPVLRSALHAEFSWRRESADGSFAGTVSLRRRAGAPPLTFGDPATFGVVLLDELSLEGLLTNRQLAVSGRAGNLRVEPNPLGLNISDAVVGLMRSEERQEFRISFDKELRFAPFSLAGRPSLLVRVAGGAVAATLELHWPAGILPLGPLRLQHVGITLRGNFGAGSFHVGGAIDGLQVDLPPVHTKFHEPILIDLERTTTGGGAAASTLSLRLGSVAVGCLGEIKEARLILKGHEDAASQDYTLEYIDLSGKCAWQRLPSLVALPADSQIQLSDNVSVATKLKWRGQSSDTGTSLDTLKVNFEVDLPDFRTLTGAIPGLEVKDAKFVYEGEVASGANFPAFPTPGALVSLMSGRADIDFLLRLSPLVDLPPNDFLNVQMPEWVRARAEVVRRPAQTAAGSAEAGAAAEVRVVSPTQGTPVIVIDLNLPGQFRQADAPVRLHVDAISASATPGGVVLTLDGGFVLRGFTPPATLLPPSPHLSALLSGWHGLTGRATLKLRLRAGTATATSFTAAEATLECVFDESARLSVGGLAGIKLDRLDLSADLERLAASTLKVSISPLPAAEIAHAAQGFTFELPGGFNLNRFGQLKRAMLTFDDAEGQPRFSCGATWSDGQIQLGSGRLTFPQFDFNARFSASGEISGSGKLVGGTGHGISAQLGDLTFEIERAGIEEFEWRQAELVSLRLAAGISFGRLQGVFNLPREFPYQLGSGAEVEFELSCRKAGSSYEISVTASAAAEGMSRLPLLPAAAQPEIRDSRLTLKASALLPPQGGAQSAAAGVSASLTMGVRGLPVRLPEEVEQVVKVRVGEDTTGWMRVGISGSLAQFSGTSGSLSLEVFDAVSTEINLPGLPQSRPPIVLKLERIALSLSAERDTQGATRGGCKLEARGSFVLRQIRPPASVPFSAQLEQFLSDLRDVSGIATLAVSIESDGKVHLTLDCGLESAGIEANLLELLQGITRGTVESSVGRAPAFGEPTFRFGLKSLRLKIDSPIGASEEEVASVAVVLSFGFGAMLDDVDVLLRLSDRSLSVYLDGVRIPLVVPKFPFTSTDLNAINEVQPSASLSEQRAEEMNRAAWNQKLGDLSAEQTAAEGQVASLEAEIKEKQRRLAQEAMGIDEREALKRELVEARQALRRQQADLFVAVVRHGFLQGMWEVRRRLTAENRRAVYRQWLNLLSAALEVQRGIPTLVGEPLWNSGSCDIVFEQAGITIPFSDPRGSRVSGTAHLEFPREHVLSVLNHFALSLGLSADMVYVSGEIREDSRDAEAARSSSAITIPAFGRYEEGKVLPGKLAVGYGYQTSSLDIDLAGGLMLPPMFIEDAETSDRIGAGVRLPRKAQVAFKVKLLRMPHPIYVFPIFNFRFDFRADFSPGLLGTRTCEPFWDGIELNVEGVIRLALKNISFSPIFMVLPAPTVEFDGTLMLGDEKNGLTVIIDHLLDLLWINFYVPLKIPFLAGPESPFFNNLCFNVRLAGFGVGFDVQRPMPDFSPFAIFELLGLLSDPTLEIDPEGALANSLRISLVDAHITLPEELWPLFPSAEKVFRKQPNITLNVATFLSAAGKILELVKMVVREVAEEGGHIAYAVERLKKNPPRIATDPPQEPAALFLRALPPELKKLRLAASFAGFEGEAVIALIDREEAKDEFRRRDNASPPPQFDGLAPTDDPAPSPGGGPAPQWLGGDVESLAEFAPNLRGRRGGRAHSPSDATANLFAGSEFRDFVFEDLESVESPREGDKAAPAGAKGVVVSAHARLIDGQRYRFIGTLFQDGYFTLVTKANLRRPLRVNVNGIPVPLSLDIEGRLKLKGRARRAGSYASVEAGVYAHWAVMQDVLSLEIGTHDEDKNLRHPATLKLYSDGRFAVKGSFAAELFGGAATFAGTIDAAHDHCHLLNGSLRCAIGSLLRLPAAPAVGVAEVRGAVTDPSGAAVAMANVVVRNVLLGITHAATTNEDGAFRLGGLHPGARYTIEVTASGFRPERRVALTLAHGKTEVINVTLTPGSAPQTPDSDAELPPLIEFSMDNVNGRVGPGARFEVEGEAALKIGGVPLTGVRARVSERGAEVSGRFSLDAPRWLTGDELPFSLEADLSGKIELKSKTLPEFSLSGRGTLHLKELRLSIDGAIAISAHEGKLKTVIEGAMSWRAIQDPHHPAEGQVWANARVELTEGEVTVSGSLAFALEPPSLPSNIELLRPSLHVNLDGTFTFAVGLGTSALTRITLQAQSVLGISPPQTNAGDERQILPVAAGSLKAEFPSGEYPERRFKLVNFRGFGVLTPRTLFERFTTSPVSVKKFTISKSGEFQLPDIRFQTDQPRIGGRTYDRIPGAPPGWWWSAGNIPSLSLVEDGNLVTFDLPQLPALPPSGELFRAPVAGFSIDLVWDSGGFFKFEVAS